MAEKASKQCLSLRGHHLSLGFPLSCLPWMMGCDLGLDEITPSLPEAASGQYSSQQ